MQLEDAELVEVAAKCLRGLMEVYADEAASTKAKVDDAVDQCMQGLAKSKSTTDVEPKTNATGAASAVSPKVTDKSSTYEVDEDGSPLNHCGKEGRCLSTECNFWGTCHSTGSQSANPLSFSFRTRRCECQQPTHKSSSSEAIAV